MPLTCARTATWSRMPTTRRVKWTGWCVRRACRRQTRVLDLCCGQGRHTLDLARRGHTHVTGLDRSRYLVTLARKRARAAGLKASFHEGDARQFQLRRSSVRRGRGARQFLRLLRSVRRRSGRASFDSKRARHPRHRGARHLRWSLGTREFRTPLLGMDRCEHARLPRTRAVCRPYATRVSRSRGQHVARCRGRSILRTAPVRPRHAATPFRPPQSSATSASTTS